MQEKNFLHEKNPNYEVVIGIEVHVQLKTKSKIFCSCDNEKGTDSGPNSTVCQICMGHPGVLPVLNNEVINSAIKAGIATKSKIASISHFDRKHYFYPDLPKNYQITQQYNPICVDGHVPIRLEDGSIKNIRLSRIHIEEDAGKSTHSQKHNESFVDLNRAGTPLLEIVSLPDIRSSYEARAYLKMLRSIVQTIDICTGNMEEGSFRADTNISIRKKGVATLGTKCELKNINSFKYISDAIEYEIERQVEVVEQGGIIKQETRLWDPKKKQTFIMRTKEEAADYRFFNEPDLPPIFVSDTMIKNIQATLPELPYDTFDRFIKQYDLTPYEATILIDDQELANYFEETQKYTQGKTIINWILRDLVSLCKEQKISYNQSPITPKQLSTITKYIDDGIITARIAKDIFDAVLKTKQDPEIIIQTLHLPKQSSAADFEILGKSIIAEFPTQTAEYKSGKTKLLGFFVGKAMEKTKGSVNPAIITEIFKKLLQ